MFKFTPKWNPLIPKPKRKRGPKDYDLWPVCQANLIAEMETCGNQSDAELHHKSDPKGEGWSVLYLCKDCLIKQDKVHEPQGHENGVYPYMFRVHVSYKVGEFEENRIYSVINLSSMEVVDEVPFQ